MVAVATSSHEGADRTSLAFGNNQDELVEAIAGWSDKVVVVGTTPGAVLTPWRHNVSAVVINFMPGQEAGNAVADILFGKVNPSARMPLTFPNKENEQNFSPSQWPGVNGQATYSEGLCALLGVVARCVWCESLHTRLSHTRAACSCWVPLV